MAMARSTTMVGISLFIIGIVLMYSLLSITEFVKVISILLLCRVVTDYYADDARQVKKEQVLTAMICITYRTQLSLYNKMTSSV